MTERETLCLNVGFQKGWSEGFKAALDFVSGNIESIKQNYELMKSSLDPDEKQA